MICETSSTYALYYAKSLSLKLSLVHIQENDKLAFIEKVYADIQRLAASLEVEVELILYDNFEEFEQFIKDKNVDILFCSTKHKHSLFEESFAKRVIKLDMRVDLAIVKVVKFATANSVDKIIMPIRGHHLSVNKFTFFSSLVNAYYAKAEIFSVDEITKHQMASLDAKAMKVKLQDVLFHLRHYFRLADIMKLKFTMKHRYALSRQDEIQAHITKNSYDLAIVGGHRKKNFFYHNFIETLLEKPILNTIYFIPFNDEV